jgi:hypothetical protein
MWSSVLANWHEQPTSVRRDKRVPVARFLHKPTQFLLFFSRPAELRLVARLRVEQREHVLLSADVCLPGGRLTHRLCHGQREQHGRWLVSMELFLWKHHQALAGHVDELHLQLR